jgi:uncharacterized protein (DUF362 family)
MTSKHGGLTRRDVIAGLVGSAAAAAMSLERGEAAPAKARVVRVESPDVWRGERRDPEVVTAMLHRGLVALSGETKPAEAWRRYFAPGTRVGLKINLLGRPLIYTARELTDAVAAGVIAAGVKPADVVVWDRHGGHFGPTVYKPGPGALGERIVVGGRYDARNAVRASGGIAPIDTIATEETDVTVNLPVLKDHSGAGVTLSLKNIAFGCYDHHAGAHGGNCDPFIGEAYEHFTRTTRVPLIVLDATLACFEGGPAPRNPDSLWREGAIYLATDPVALDVVCRQVIMDKRQAMGRSDRTRDCHHIETAASKGLGIGDRARIDLVTLRV